MSSVDYDVEREPLVAKHTVPQGATASQANGPRQSRVRRAHHIALAAIVSVAILGLVWLWSGLHRGSSNPGSPEPLPIELKPGETLLQNIQSLMLDEELDLNFDGDEPVDVFDATQPTYRDLGAPVAEEVLVDSYEFGNSWGKPFVGKYMPPDVDFTHVHLELKASTWGRQFDRLAHVVLNGAEIWRTSTAEPSNRNITFGYTKDVSPYTALFKEGGDIAFVLNNVVDDTYTGPITLSLKATFYNVEEDSDSTLSAVDLAFSEPERTADSVTPLTPSSGLIWSTPGDKISYTVPALAKNTTKVVLDVFSSGNGDEEFWYGNLLDSLGDEPGHGPIRVVEVLVDGNWAGVAVPYPVIYTGGFSPSLWSRIVGSKTYDVPSHLIDLTPFLPLLWEGAEISLQVANGGSLSDPKRLQINNNWFVSANLLKWETAGVEGSGKLLDDGNRIARDIIAIPGKSATQIISQSLNVRTGALLTFDSEAGSSTGVLSWSQNVTISNVEVVSDGGRKQSIVMSSNFHDGLLLNGFPLNSRHGSGGLVLDMSYASENRTYKVGYVRGYGTSDGDVAIGSGQNGTSTFQFVGPRTVIGFGSMESKYKQTWLPEDIKICRHVRADNGTLTHDDAECPHKNGEYAATELVPGILIDDEAAAAMGLAGLGALGEPGLSALSNLGLGSSVELSPDMSSADLCALVPGLCSM